MIISHSFCVLADTKWVKQPPCLCSPQRTADPLSTVHLMQENTRALDDTHKLCMHLCVLGVIKGPCSITSLLRWPFYALVYRPRKAQVVVYKDWVFLRAVEELSISCTMLSGISIKCSSKWGWLLDWSNFIYHHVFDSGLRGSVLWLWFCHCSMLNCWLWWAERLNLPWNLPAFFWASLPSSVIDKEETRPSEPLALRFAGPSGSWLAAQTC